VSHLLQRAQKLRHSNFAAEQRRYTARLARRGSDETPIED
jgi:hypothetical protein